MAKKLKIHPACEALPKISEEDYEALREAIRAYGGLRDPITLLDGEVIDGRNRVKICEELGLEPDLFEVDEAGLGGMTPEEYAWQCNIRRNITAAQKAAYAAQHFFPAAQAEAAERLKTSGKNGASGKNTTGASARDAAGARVGCGDSYVEWAARIKEASPAAFAGLLSGELSMGEAKKKAGLSRKKPAEQKVTEDREDGVYSVSAAAAPFNSIRGHLDSAVREAKEIAEERIGGHMAQLLGDFQKDIRAARATLRNATPAAVCPDCKGKGCRHCGDVGFINAKTKREAAKA